MSLIPAPIPLGATGPQVTALQSALLALGFALAPDEVASGSVNGRFGPATQIAVHVFRQRMGLPTVPPNVTPFDEAAARLLNVVVQANGTSDAFLSVAVRESLAAAQGATPLEIGWLGRYALMARDYTAARQAAALAPSDPIITNVVQPVAGDASFQTPRPELQNPENFYTCRYDFVPQAALDELLGRSGASDGPATQFRLARRRPSKSGGEDDWPDVPPDLPDPPPPPPDPGLPVRLANIAAAASKWAQAVDFWQKGHREFKAQRYANAVANYDAAQDAAAAYFEKFYDITPEASLPGRVIAAALKFATNDSAFPRLWELIRRRRVAVTLAELQQIDWSGYSFAASGSHALLQKNLSRTGNGFDSLEENATRQQVLDRFALLLATVFVPLARSEANRMRRFFSDALADLERVRAPFRVNTTNSFPGGGGGGGGVGVAALPASAAAIAPSAPSAVAAATAVLPAIPSAAAVSVVDLFGRPVWLTSDLIERSFVRLAMAETLFERAETEYKADLPAASTLPALPVVAEERADSWPKQGFAFSTHGLRAAQTYLQITGMFASVGAYAERVRNGRDELTQGAKDPNAPGFHAVGKNLTLPTTGTNVPTVQSATPSLPGLARSKSPAAPFLTLVPSVDGEAVSETNPRVYALLLMTQARLEQIKYNFNYLGYPDDYVPPWRFQFLLERARYFAEHAKAAERDYLNFLNNAEHEEYQELSASQAVEMEKANVCIETRRVDQAAAEVTAATKSQEQAVMASNDAQTRLKNFVEFDNKMKELETSSLLESIGVGVLKGVAVAATIALAPAAAPGAIALVSAAGAAKVGESLVEGAGTVLATDNANAKAAAQRDLEKKNLELARNEALKATEVAAAHADVARAGLVVAGLQRQAALLRHEFALQNLSFLRNRQLNPEQWLRLANSIRGISDTYLRYAIQLAFLAEQAYEFEADTRINVIRFDYDISDVGAFLAADFLLRDLDTIERDLVVNQRQRQQEVRYVLSMAREFPEALQDLKDTGRTTFSLRLEQIERRFPGLYNARIGSVDVLPVALLDNTRFRLELRHLGSGQVRLKANPDTLDGQDSTSPLNQNDLPVRSGGWLSDLVDEWPIKLRTYEPQTNVYSGLSRQDAAAAFPIASSGQRNAFEGLAAASAWEIDMSARDNGLVPGTLTDVLITFALSAFHDGHLRAAIDVMKPQTTALTSFVSAQQLFPDAFYDFHRTGRMVWKLRREMLALNGDVGRLRNIGFTLQPGPPDVHFSRMTARLRASFRINEAAGVPASLTVFSAVPETLVTQIAPLTVSVRAAMNGATELAWDFGDGTPILRSVRSGTAVLPPAEGTHTYARPGRYVLKLRCVQNDSLAEFRIAITVSRTQKLGDPLIIWLRFALDPATKALTLGTGGAVQQAGRMLWRIGDLTAEGNTATFQLKPGNYIVDFAAVRKLNFRAYGAQRYLNGAVPLPLRGLSATTNRIFDTNGKETNGTGMPPLPVRNELARRLFDKGAISPDDDWTFELIPEEILGVPAGSAMGGEELDLSDIQDVALSMEYDVTPG